MLDLMKSKRVWAASLCASVYATIPFVLFPVYFALIIFAIRTGRDRAISYFDAPRYGAHLALRVLTAISLLGVLRFDFATNCIEQRFGSRLNIESSEAAAKYDLVYSNCWQVSNDIVDLIRALLFCGLIWFWIKHDRRSLTVTHIGSTALVAFAALLVNAALTRTQSDVSSAWTLSLVYARLDITNILLTYSEVTFQVVTVAALGYLLGHLCAPCFSRPGQLPHRINFSLKLNANWLQASILQWHQLLTGFIAACVLTALFTAENSALYKMWPLDWLYAYNYEYRDNKLIDSFTYEAILNGLSGARKALPFIAMGTILVWLLGKARLSGIIPTLAVGAIMGRLAGIAMGPIYETPFLSPLNCATLIGMIIAAGFGMAANACAPREPNNHKALDKMVT
jgi:hypothetical protein